MIIIIKEREADDYGDGELFLFEAKNDKGETEGFSAGRGEPEDNSLGRDLNFVYGIEAIAKLAYEAGKAGEEFTVLKEAAGNERK